MLTIVVSTIDKDENFNSMLLKSVGLKDVELLISKNFFFTCTTFLPVQGDVS